MDTHSIQEPAHPSASEHGLAVTIALWTILAGILVVVANAWAAGMIGQ